MRKKRRWYAENGYGDSPYISERMSDYRIQELWEFSILDWLHSAAEEELPDGQKELGEIGRELRELREKAMRKQWSGFMRFFHKQSCQRKAPQAHFLRMARLKGYV